MLPTVKINVIINRRFNIGSGKNYNININFNINFNFGEVDI